MRKKKESHVVNAFIRKWLATEHERFWEREWKKMSAPEQRVLDAWAYIEDCEEVTVPVDE